MDLEEERDKEDDEEEQEEDRYMLTVLNGLCEYLTGKKGSN